MIDRRTFLGAGAAVIATSAQLAQAAETAQASHAAHGTHTAKPAATGAHTFPAGFLWGAATAGHQVEGNNVSSDLWLLEHLQPSVFAEPSGDAVNSFELWPTDLDLVKHIGLNTYRFSLEWARIEPELGQVSIAMLDHYKAIIEGCRARGLTPLVTFNHFTSPRWFAARGGWTASDAPDVFAAYCDRAARHLAEHIGHATTFNEPNLPRLLASMGLPPAVTEAARANLAAAGRVTGSSHFVATNVTIPEDVDNMLGLMIKGHHQARAAIKAVRSDLPVGVSLAMFDDQAVGENSVRDKARADLYGPWLEAAKGDDFLGVQNYERVRYDAKGRLPPPDDAERNWSGGEVYAPSLAGAVRYAHEATGLPIMVTEHGVGTDDDSIRARLIPAALTELKKVMDDGVPVRGYVHWSLLDNFEWIFGYKPHYGLASVDRTTFKRTLKPSAGVLGAIAKRNAV